MGHRNDYDERILRRDNIGLLKLQPLSDVVASNRGMDVIFLVIQEIMRSGM